MVWQLPRSRLLLQPINTDASDTLPSSVLLGMVNPAALLTRRSHYRMMTAVRYVTKVGREATSSRQYPGEEYHVVCRQIPMTESSQSEHAGNRASGTCDEA